VSVYFCFESLRDSVEAMSLVDLVIALGLVGKELIDRGEDVAAHHVAQAIGRLVLSQHNARARSATTEPPRGAGA